MMKIAVANGDGIGEEIMAAVIDVFNVSQIPFQYHCKYM
jgi:isocitrate/isopropylmalate dehydrogenase